MHVLIIEDDRDAAGYMAKGLKESGHNVEVVHGGREGLLLAAGADYDALIVDRMLPELDGLEPGQDAARHRQSDAGAVRQRPGRGRRAGQGPAQRRRRLSRQALRLLRTAGAARSGGPASCRTRRRRPETVLRYHDLSLDLLARRVMRGGKPIDLQPREFKLLEVLMRHAGQVMTRTMLLEKVWDYRFDPQTNVIDVHISRLRQKVDRGYAQPADPDGPRRRIQPACPGPGRLRAPPSG